MKNVFINRLRASGLRPTKQRIEICKVLFDRKETFHFTIDKLKKIIEKNTKGKISLATLYNTIHAFKNNEYLKEISLHGNKTFFDTNSNNHHGCRAYMSSFEPGLGATLHPIQWRRSLY